MEFEYSITDSVMPFGKFKGTTINALPTDYLEWWNREVNIRKLKDPALRFALAAEWKKRVEKKGTGKK